MSQSGIIVIFAALIVIVMISGIEAQPDDLIRNVTGGQVKGTMDAVYADIASWRGIPFATAKRFLPPGPVESWSGVRDASKYGPGCASRCVMPHPELTCAPTQDEANCLNINVFVPSGASSGGKLLPVMLFIPGGAFEQGAGGSAIYWGASIASRQQAIVVTFNYRLLAFGSLVSPTSGSPVTGNMNIKDQRMAMEWVKANIYQFGGDPSAVTLTGESAGAISVGLHVLTSPKSQGFFRSAVMSSNPLGLPIQTLSKSKSLGAKFLAAVKCDGFSTDPQKELECLQAVPAAVIVNVSLKTRNPIGDGLWDEVLPWQPTVDGVEIIGQQIGLAQAGQALGSNLSMLVTNNYQDVFLFVAEASPVKAISYFELDLALAALFGVKNAYRLRKLFPYVKGKMPSHDSRPLFGDIMTAYLMTCPARALARSRGPKSTTFLGIFDVLATTNTWFWGNKSGSGYADCGKFSQICHASDLPFLFNGTEQHITPPAPAMSGADYVAGRTLQDAYGSIIRGASPPNNWPPSTKEEDVRYFVRAPNSGVVKQYQGKICDFMDTMGYSRDVNLRQAMRVISDERMRRASLKK